jgi:hypothetical protein
VTLHRRIKTPITWFQAIYWRLLILHVINSSACRTMLGPQIMRFCHTMHCITVLTFLKKKLNWDITVRKQSHNHISWICFLYQVKLYYDRRSVGQSILMSDTPLGPATNFSFFLELFLDRYWFNDVGRLLWREVGSVVFSWEQCIDSIFETPPNLEGHVPVFISPRNRVVPPGIGFPVRYTYCGIFT